MTRQVNPLPIFGRGFTSKSAVVTRQMLTNLYREPEAQLQTSNYQIEQDKTAMALYGTPGKTLVGSGFSGPSRGAKAVQNTLYSVHGASVYAINNAWQYTLIGTLNTSTGRVGIETNGFQLMIVDGTNGYIYTYATQIFGTITDPNFPNGATTVAFLASYFIVDNQQPNGVGQFNWSSTYDGTTWQASNFATAEFSPYANLVAVASLGGYLYLFGVRTTEIWAASGTTAVFARVGGAGLQYGLASRWSVCEYKDRLAHVPGH